MNQNEQRSNNSDTKINDLNVTDVDQAEIKGGPKRIFIGGLSVAPTPGDLADLAPGNTEQIKGGPPPKSKRFLVLQSSVANDNNE